MIFPLQSLFQRVEKMGSKLKPSTVKCSDFSDVTPFYNTLTLLPLRCFKLHTGNSPWFPNLPYSALHFGYSISFFFYLYINISYRHHIEIKVIHDKLRLIFLSVRHHYHLVQLDYLFASHSSCSTRSKQQVLSTVQRSKHR